MLLYFPAFDPNIHQNKDVMQFPLHLSKALNDPLKIAADTTPADDIGVEVLRTGGFLSLARHIKANDEKHLILYFMNGKTKLRSIFLKLLFPELKIIVKADQNEKTFSAQRHQANTQGKAPFFLRRLENKLFYRAVSAICVETKSVKAALSNLPEAANVVFHMPNGSSVAPDLPTKENIILFVGRHEADQKNFGLLEQAIRNSQKALQGWRVEVLGGEARESDIDLMSFAGSVPHSDTIDRMAKAKILALSSHHEGSPIVFAEAKACGCAILTTDVSAAGDYVATPNDGAISDHTLDGYTEKLQALVARCNTAEIDFQAIQNQYLDQMDWKATTKALARKLSNTGG